MKTSWYQLRKNMEDKRINDEVLTAKKTSRRSSGTDMDRGASFK